jgi:hypothetical protein
MRRPVLSSSEGDLYVDKIGFTGTEFLPKDYLDEADLRAARLAVTARAEDVDDARLLLTALGLVDDTEQHPADVRSPYGRAAYPRRLRGDDHG